MLSYLPNYLTNFQIWIDLLPIPISALFFSAIAAGLTGLSKDPAVSFCERWCVFAAFALLGFIVGDLTGQSREPAVPAAIGAVLTLLAAAMVYLLGSHGPKKQLFVSAAVCILTISLFFGTNWGSVLREDADTYKLSARYRWSLEQEDQKLQDLRNLYRAVNGTPSR
jgi:hypothetical protein